MVSGARGWQGGPGGMVPGPAKRRFKRPDELTGRQCRTLAIAVLSGLVTLDEPMHVESIGKAFNLSRRQVDRIVVGLRSKGGPDAA